MENKFKVVADKLCMGSEEVGYRLHVDNGVDEVVFDVDSNDIKGFVNILGCKLKKGKIVKGVLKDSKVKFGATDNIQQVSSERDLMIIINMLRNNQRSVSYKGGLRNTEIDVNSAGAKFTDEYNKVLKAVDGVKCDILVSSGDAKGSISIDVTAFTKKDILRIFYNLGNSSSCKLVSEGYNLGNHGYTNIEVNFDGSFEDFYNRVCSSMRFIFFDLRNKEQNYNCFLTEDGCYELRYNLDN